jgi:aminoglycoside 3-N-acetyltransferase I
MPEIQVARLTGADVAVARTLFATMAGVFETEVGTLTDAYLARVLHRADVWAYVGTVDGQTVGGLTAYTLPLTRAEVSELFIYDIAVVAQWQRHGVGRALIAALRADAATVGITVAFVPADNDDVHALDFYRALGGAPAPVTIFTFGESDP